MQLLPTMSKNGAIPVLTMTYPPYRSLRELSMAKSFCTTTFVNHLACGCVPFGRADWHAARVERVSHIIVVNRDVLSLIRNGKLIAAGPLQSQISLTRQI